MEIETIKVLVAKCVGEYVSGYAAERCQQEPDQSLKAMGMDSLDHVELIMCLEDECSIEISDEIAEGLDTLNKLAGYIDTKLKARKV